MLLFITIIPKPFILRISFKKLFYLLFCGIIIGDIEPFFASSFTVVYLFITSFQISNHENCNHHFVLWVHDDHGLDFVPFYR